MYWLRLELYKIESLSGIDKIVKEKCGLPK
jgi:hypothetical protein